VDHNILRLGFVALGERIQYFDTVYSLTGWSLVVFAVLKS
jgi:hypothetical protein